MEPRDDLGRPMGDELNRRYETDPNRFYERTNDDSSLAWIGGLFAFMLVIGGLFYAFSGSDGDRVAATNATPPAPITTPAPAPTPAAPPAAPAQ